MKLTVRAAILFLAFFSENLFCAQAQTYCPIVQTSRAEQCPLINPTEIDQFTGRDSVLIGGHPKQDVRGQLVPPGTLAVPSKVSVFGTPDGTYNEGCSLCLFMGRTQWNAQRAAVSGIDYRAGASAITGYNDAVGLYSWSGNIPPTLALQVDYYDATHVYLKTPLTPEQMTLLHSNQYLTTNSLYIPSSSVYKPIEERPSNQTTWQEGYYKGIIAGWDEAEGHFIRVVAWAAPASKDTSPGQVPTPIKPGAPTVLDRLFTHYATPTVFIGAVTGVSAKNEFITLDQRNISLVRSAQVDEQDLQYFALSQHSIAHDNIVISDAGMEHSPYSGLAAFTTDSRVFRINSQKPVIFDIGMEGQATLFKTASFVVRGQSGVNSPNAITRATMAGWGAYSDGTNKMNLVSYLKKENALLGAAGTSVHLGLELDGDLNTPESGRSWGQIVWNAQASSPAGIALCGSAGTEHCGLSVAANNTVAANAITLRAQQGITFTPYNPASGSPYLFGSDGHTLTFGKSTGGYADLKAESALFKGYVSSARILAANGGAVSFEPSSGSASGVPYIAATNAATLVLKTSLGGNASLSGNVLSAAGGVQNASYSIAHLPRSGFADGTQVWCTDCILNGLKGVVVFWHTHAKKMDRQPKRAAYTLPLKALRQHTNTE